MTDLEKLHKLTHEYNEAQSADQTAMQAHIEIADAKERGENVTQADVEAAAQVAETTYDARLAAYAALDAHKAWMLQPAFETVSFVNGEVDYSGADIRPLEEIF